MSGAEYQKFFVPFDITMRKNTEHIVRRTHSFLTDLKSVEAVITNSTPQAQ